MKSLPLFFKTSSLLFALMAAGIQSAQATCPTGVPQCAPSVSYVTVTTLPAVQMEVSATQNAQGSWDYSYQVVRASGNTSPAPFYLQSFALPYYADQGITNLRTVWVDGGGAYVQGASTITASITSAPDASQAINLSQGSLLGANVSNLPHDVSVKLLFTSPFAPTAVGNALMDFQGTQYWGTINGFGSDATRYTGVTPSTLAKISAALPGSPLALAGTVPEPGTWALMGLGLLGMAASNRRQGGRV